MMPRRLASSLVLLVSGTLTTAVAQELPTWSVAEICAKEPQQCTLSEGLARQSVTGSWSVLPDAYRTACLGEARSPLDRSWRLLSQCLELQVLKGLDRRAIATAATPAEPAPPPAAAADGATGVPPPPFGVPTAPPKID